MKQNYKKYLNEILDEIDIEILKKIKKAGSNTGYDLREMCIGPKPYWKQPDWYEYNEKYDNFIKKLNKYANYGLLRKMGMSYTDEDGAYYCISSDGLEFLEN